jgi:hypothetical protein
VADFLPLLRRAAPDTWPGRNTGAALSHQRDIKIEFRKVAGADHYFADRLDTMAGHADNHIRAHAGLGGRRRPR